MKVNTITTADYYLSDADREKLASMNARIGLYATHNEALRFRKIEIKELPPDEPGWVQLFNGKDLSGWKLHPDQRGAWTVNGGVLTGFGPEVNWLYSERGDYENFHLRVEAQLLLGGSRSGLFFRCHYGPSEPDTWPHGYEAVIGSQSIFFGKWAEIHTGTLQRVVPYQKRDGVDLPPEFGPKTPTTALDKWFTMEIIARGNHIVIRVDGKTVVDMRDAKHCFTRGHIALSHQLPDTVIRFKKIEIKELPPEEPGWVQLFGGGDRKGWEDLKGWETFAGGTDRWKVVDGSLTCDGPHSYLFTKRDDYKDFHFRVEARLNAKGISGQCFRCRRDGPGWPKGYWAAITHSNPVAAGMAHTGDLGRVRATGEGDTLVKVAGGLVVDGAWFTQEVIARGNHIQILVNGQKVAVHHRADGLADRPLDLFAEH